MCKTTDTTPLTAVGPQMSFQPGQGSTTSDDGLQEPNAGNVTMAPGSNPQQTATPSGAVQTRPTKFGSLLNFALPLLQGGLVGLAGGKTQGGGFNAAQNFYNQRRQLAMQYALMNRSLNNDQFRNMLELARTQHTMNQPYFTGRGNQPIAARTQDGREVFMRPNPYSGQMEEVPGYSPVQKTQVKQPSAHYRTDLDRGVVVNEDAGTYKPIVREGSGDQGTQEAASGLPSTFADGLPVAPTITQIARDKQLPTQTPTGPRTIPTTPPGSVSPTNGQTGGAGMAGNGNGLPPNPKTTQPKPIVRSNRDAKGNETDSIYDENPQSPTFGKSIKTLPTHRAGVASANADAKATAKTDLSANVESYAAAALEKNGNDPDKAIAYLNGLKNTDPEIQKNFTAILPEIRKRIMDRTKKSPGKKRLSLSPNDAAAIGASPTESSVTGDDDEE